MCEYITVKSLYFAMIALRLKSPKKAKVMIIFKGIRNVFLQQVNTNKSVTLCLYEELSGIIFKHSTYLDLRYMYLQVNLVLDENTGDFSSRCEVLRISHAGLKIMIYRNVLKY